ncbi:hypothetical protein OK016_22575 [Vibrio chagasii]|nr:hypothetical protein [Vibrio chagasii]
MSYAKLQHVIDRKLCLPSYRFALFFCVSAKLEPPRQPAQVISSLNGHAGSSHQFCSPADTAAFKDILTDARPSAYYNTTPTKPGDACEAPFE